MSSWRLPWLFLLCLSCACSSTGDAFPPADVVFRGGLVYTPGDRQPRARVVAVRGGKIVFVGNDLDVEAQPGPGTEIVDIGDGLLLPGFHDSHSHPMAAGTRMLRCDLEGLTWPEAVLAALRTCETKLQEGEWLRGINLAPEAFREPGPDSNPLDAIPGKRPSLIQSTGNRFWANSATLELAGISEQTPDPLHGRIGRLPGGNEPSGLLVGAAVNKVYRLLPIPDDSALRRSLQWASEQANRFGIVSSNESAAPPKLVAAFLSAARYDELHRLRLQVAQRWDPERGMEQFQAMLNAADLNDKRMLNLRSVKLFLDGDSHDRSAALLAPYENADGSRGSLNFKDAELFEIVRRVDAAGFDLHFHAWGDRAVRQALDAIEHAIRGNPEWDRRHQVAHLGLIHPDDLPRFAALNVTADVQPLWANRKEARGSLVDVLGAERAERLIPVRGLFDAGVRVVAGSDWISESMNPLVAIQYAVTRQMLDGSDEPWIPVERASLAQMLEAYTINGAWIARQEHLTGSIEVGKAADMVLLDRNLFEIPPREIAQARVRMTLVNGRVVYRQDPGDEDSVE